MPETSPKKFPPDRSAYGGTLLKTRKGRARARPISTGQTMHLVLRSTRATGPWSFRQPKNYSGVEKILEKFSTKHGVRLHSYAINLNHLHLHVKVASRQGYKRFIRAISAAIAMLVMRKSRWRQVALKFWDYRPFSRVVVGERGRQTMRDYIRLNQLESIGCNRVEGRFYVRLEKAALAELALWRKRQT